MAWGGVNHNVIIILGELSRKSVNILIVNCWWRHQQEADTKNPKQALLLDYAKTNNYFDFEE